MKVYNLSPHYSKEEIAERKGDWITDKDYDYVIKDDCDAYGENGEPLFFFRKNPNQLFNHNTYNKYFNSNI